MPERPGSTGAQGRRESRRRFFKLLASSPLLATAYPVLPSSWQDAIAEEAVHGAAAGPRPTGVPCPDCGAEMVFPPSPDTRLSAQDSANPLTLDRNRFLEAQLAGQVVESPELAANVWDMEMTTHAHNLPEHWAYLHLGVDDFETRVANREGFNRLAVRPRRLGQDTSNLDTSVELFGKQYGTPLFTCPVAALQGVPHAGRGRGRSGRQGPGCVRLPVAQQFDVV